MSQQEERLKILDMLRDGVIKPDEAERLLAVLGDEPLTPPDDDQIITFPRDHQDLPDREKLWLFPFGAGLGMVGFFGLLMSWMGVMVAYICLSPFLLVGAGLAAIGFWSRSSHWIHVRIREENGHHIRISLPFPVLFTGWVLSVLEPYIKFRGGDVDLNSLNLGQLVQQMGDTLSDENPLLVAVDDNKDSVLVYIT